MRALTSPPTAQPAKGVFAVRRITIRRAAATIGISELVLGRILNGYERPSARVRAGLAALLSLPEAQLFVEESPASERRGLLR
jgi:transcriptional regulator with XRE-family HTH domain